MFCAFFWVIPQHLNFICQCSGTPCLFHLRTYPPMKMGQTQCSETLAYKIQMPGSYPLESTQHSEQGESLKSRKHLKSSGFRFSGAFIILGLLDSWRWRHYIPSKLYTQWRSVTCPRWLESSATLLWEPQIVHLNNLLLLFLFLLLSRVKWAADRLNCLHTS